MNNLATIALKTIKDKYLNHESFVPIDSYRNLFGIQIFKSGRKHIKEEHVYYCYTPNNFDYSVYKKFITELRDYEQKHNYEFRKTYNISRYEIYGNLYLYQLNSCDKNWKVNFTKFEWLKLTNHD